MPMFTLGGVVNGLDGSGLTLSVTYNYNSQITHSTEVAANGEFHFPLPLVRGQIYEVSISANPIGPYQDCTVENGSGMVAAGNVTNIGVTCITVPQGAAANFALIATGGYPGAIKRFAINSNTGAFLPTPKAANFEFVGTFGNISSDSAGRFLYVPYIYDGGGTVFLINKASGALAPVSGYDVASRSMSIDPTSHFAYFAEFGNKTSAWKINLTTGELAPIASVNLPPDDSSYGPYVIVVDPLGRFVYAANAASISSLRIDDASGALSNSAALPFTGGAIAMAADPQGKYVYVLPTGGNQLLAFAVDDRSGALTPASTILAVAGTTPTSIAIDPAGKFLYVTNASSRDISAFAIDAASGALSALAGGPIAAQGTPSSITIDPYGKFAYVLNGAPENTVAVYTIDASGALAPVAGGVVNTGATPIGIALVK
jgi:6-phosphogluconolactonase (cycloisomerase 2 family)